MFDVVSRFFMGPSIKGFPLAVQAYLSAPDPRSIAISDEDYPSLIELLNCEIEFVGLAKLSDVNVIPRLGFCKFLFTTCLTFVRVGFAGELFKRGMNPNLKELNDNGTYCYSTIRAAHPVHRWSLRLLVLQGANFNLVGTDDQLTPIEERNKSARMIMKNALAVTNFCPDLSSFTDERRYRYGPLASGRLSSQDITYITTRGLTLLQYLEQVEREVAEMQRLKEQGDNYFKQDNYFLAAEHYKKAGQYMEEFEHDHAQLQCYYFSLALPYYHNALQCYERHYITDQTPNSSEQNKQIFFSYIDSILTRIEYITTPSTPELLPPGPCTVEHPTGRNVVEDIKHIKESAVMRAIIKYRSLFMEMRHKYSLLFQGVNSQASPLTQRSHAVIRSLTDVEIQSARESILEHKMNLKKNT